MKNNKYKNNKQETDEICIIESEEVSNKLDFYEFKDRLISLNKPANKSNYNKLIINKDNNPDFKASKFHEVNTSKFLLSPNSEDDNKFKKDNLNYDNNSMMKCKSMIFNNLDFTEENLICFSSNKKNININHNKNKGQSFSSNNIPSTTKNNFNDNINNIYCNSLPNNFDKIFNFKKEELGKDIIADISFNIVDLEQKKDFRDLYDKNKTIDEFIFKNSYIKKIFTNNITVFKNIEYDDDKIKKNIYDNKNNFRENYNSNIIHFNTDSSNETSMSLKKIKNNEKNKLENSFLLKNELGNV